MCVYIYILKVPFAHKGTCVAYTRHKHVCISFKAHTRSAFQGASLYNICVSYRVLLLSTLQNDHVWRSFNTQNDQRVKASLFAELIYSLELSLCIYLFICLIIHSIMSLFHEKNLFTHISPKEETN